MAGIITFLSSRRRVVASAAALALLALLSVTIPAFGGSDGSLLARTSDAIHRFVDRSPGERGETDLIKTKVKRKKVDFSGKPRSTRLKSGDPEERALGKMFDTPPEEAVKELSDNPLGPLALGDPDPALFPLDNIGSIGSPTGPGFPGGISTIVPPGPTVPGDPTTPPDPDPGTPVAGAVPEPETWALMILGFGLCAVALRRRREQPLGQSSTV